MKIQEILLIGTLLIKCLISVILTHMVKFPLHLKMRNLILILMKYLVILIMIAKSKSLSYSRTRMAGMLIKI